MEIVGCAASVSQLLVYTALSMGRLEKLSAELRDNGSTHRDDEMNITLLLSILQRVAQNDEIQDDSPILPVLIGISGTACHLLHLMRPRRRFGINWTPITCHEKIRSALCSLDERKRLLHLYISQTHHKALIDLRTTIIATSSMAPALEVSRSGDDTIETNTSLEIEQVDNAATTSKASPTITSNNREATAPKIGAVSSSTTDIPVHAREDVNQAHQFQVECEATPLDERIPPGCVISDAPAVLLSNDPLLSNEGSRHSKPSIGYPNDQVTTNAGPLGSSELPEGRRDSEDIESERLEILAPSVGVHANLQSHEATCSILRDAVSRMERDEDHEPLSSAVSPAGPDILDRLLLQVLLLKELKTGRGRRRALLQKLLVKALARTGMGN